MDIYGIYFGFPTKRHRFHWVFHGFPPFRMSKDFDDKLGPRIWGAHGALLSNKSRRNSRYWMGEDVNVETITVCINGSWNRLFQQNQGLGGKTWMLLLDRTGMLARHFPFFPEQFWSGFVCKNRPMSEETHHSFHLRPLNNKNFKWLQYNMGSHVWRKPFEECSTYCLPSFCMASTTGAQPCSAVKPMRRCTRQLTNHVQPKPNWVNGPRNIQFNDVFHVQSNDHPLDFWVI